MNNQAFFHPASRYNRLRATTSPADKVHGFFLSLPQQGKPDGVVWLDSETGEDKRVSRVRAFVIERAGVRELRSPSVKTALEYDGKVRVFHLELSGVESPIADCRAILIAPKELARLREADERLAQLSDVDVIKSVLTDDVLDEQTGAAEILSAIPDLDGRVDEAGQVNFERFEVPEKSFALDSKVYVVVVIDARAQ